MSMYHGWQLPSADNPDADVPDDELVAALDREATTLLSALYDATNTSGADELQAWFDARVGGTDERYPDNIRRLRATLAALHS